MTFQAWKMVFSKFHDLPWLSRRSGHPESCTYTALSHSVSECQSDKRKSQNWLSWQRPLRYQKKGRIDHLQFNTYHMVQRLWKSVQRILRYFGSERTSLLWHKIGWPWERPLRNQKNWNWSTKFTQIPSIWWKDRENRSSRYWDSFAHSKKNKKLMHAKYIASWQLSQAG